MVDVFRRMNPGICAKPRTPTPAFFKSDAASCDISASKPVRRPVIASRTNLLML